MCLKLNACPERGARLEDIPDDIRAFGKLIAELFNLIDSRVKGPKRRVRLKQADAVIKKIKEQQMQIKQEYNELVQSSSNKKGGGKSKKRKRKISKKKKQPNKRKPKITKKKKLPNKRKTKNN